MSNRNLSLDSDVAIVRRAMPDALQKHAVAADTLFGIEVLKPQGWVPVSGFFGRKLKQFDTKDAAIEACIAQWQKSGLAARPFAL